MKQLSIVIVNYNVAYFLEQCLSSVKRAIEGIDAEVFVVDNDSVDTSVAMVREKFPWVKLIASTENLGFSKGNNLAIRQSKGKYVLLLNPDTLVEEDTLRKSIDFMEAHPDAGGLGVRMIDGRGRFLPESKRGLPTPAVAFFKIFGLSVIFPKSRIFGKYHLGYLSENENHEVEVLSGAYMMMRRECLDKVGLLDEAFFMYGEDIDLSYRITQGGYRNYYLADARIIHYKGESTKKSSINYVFVFYRAMVIFAEKHFSSRRAGLFSTLINLAIYLRAGLAIAHRFARRLALPLLDFWALFGGMLLLREWYEGISGTLYPDRLTGIAFALYSLIIIAFNFLSGTYDKPLRTGSIWRGMGMSTLAVLGLYALLPENVRFSRALILLGALFGLIFYLLTRMLLQALFPEKYKAHNQKKTFGILADKKEYERIRKLLEQPDRTLSSIFRIAPPGSSDEDAPKSERLQEVIDVYKPDALIFSGHDLSAQQIISCMSAVDSKHTDFKIAPPESLYIIGSNSVEKGGELFILDVNAISKEQNRRKKRLFDMLSAFILLLSYPLSCLFVEHKGGLFRNALAVLFGRKSWVGYSRLGEAHSGLPALKPSVLDPTDRLTLLKNPEDTARKLNAVYARDYSVRGDLALLMGAFRKLGRS